MKRRSVSGTVAVFIGALALIVVSVAFFTSNWIASDYRITGAKVEKLGLWWHCFRSLPDPHDEYQRRFYVGCRWVYDPFTTGYRDIRDFLLPPFIIATQFFFTLGYVLLLAAAAAMGLFALCCGPDREKYVTLIWAMGFTFLAAGICGTIAVIIFGSLANGRDWLPEWENNYLSWSFALGVVGSFLEIVTGVLFVIEAIIQHKKRKYFKESQVTFKWSQVLNWRL